MPTTRRFDFTKDAGTGARARIGLLVLESDQTMEQEFRDLTSLPDIAIYHARLANETEVTPESLSKMADEIPKAASLLPAYLGLASLGYGCTSGATIIGESRVAAILQEHHKGVPTSNPLSAAKAALHRLGVSRLALLTPYAPDVTRAMQDSFEAAGIPVTLVGSFYESDDKVVGRIDPASIRAAALEIGKAPECDGLFISCTSLRTAGLIQHIEQTLGKPVTSSNHALAWHLLRLAGVSDRQDGFGSLFTLGLDDD